jgi:serine/threonine protein kinase/Tol biopolymer transport system component
VLAEGDLLGDCVILAPLGRGGMGEVYLARDQRLGRRVAVKVLPASLLQDGSRLARFEREARSASALNHPNICTIHALGELPDGRRFIVMEHVEGTTLRHLDRIGLELARVVQIGRQLAEGLAAAHDAGIVHRDVKPENVMVRADGLVKILDFGLAKILPESAMTDVEPTRSFDTSVAGAVVGTVKYMSPEQARGESTDARTDIWAVGAMLYELVAGQSPFEGRTASDVIANVLQSEPAPLGRFTRQCPPELQRIVSKCLRKDRGHRYQTMRDVAIDLEALGDTLRGDGRESASTASLSPAAEPSSSTSTTHSRRRWWLGAAGVIVAFVAATAVWLTWRRVPAEPASPPQRVDLVFRRLTFDGGLQTDVTFSPDGRFIAYTSDRSGNFDIWVQPVDGGDAVQITKEPAQDVQPAWSPDGDMIAFRSERSGGGIFVMPALGGRARQLSTFGSHPRWLNPAEILFLLGNPDTAGATGQLFVTPVNGDAPREVLHDFLRGSAVYWAAGHPDGRISVFTEHPRLGFGLFTATRDGKTVTASRIPPSFPLHRRVSLDSTPTRFHWTPSGTALYLEATVDGIQNLWRVTVDPRSLEWLSMERLTTGPGRDVAASLSADGQRLAYTTTSERTQVFIQSLSSDGTGLTGTPTAVTEAGAEVFGSMLSSDARRLAYVTRRAGSARFEIRLAHLDTGANELVDEDAGGAMAISWSPGESAILLPQIRRVEGGTTQESRLLRVAPGGRKTVVLPWSKFALLGGSAIGSGEFIGSIFHYSGAPSEIGTWSFDGGATLAPARVLLSDPKANLWEAALEPGRRWISFVREPIGQAQRLELMIAPAEGGPPDTWIRLMKDHAWPDKPRWSADGRLLYFLSRGTGDYFNLWALPFDPVRGVPAGRAFALTSYDSPSRFVSPHATRIGMDVAKGRVALTMSSLTGSIWMLEGIASDGAPTARVR